MLPELQQYLEKVKWHSRLEPGAEEQVVRELETYFEERVEELEGDGFSAEEAAEMAARRFGPAEAVAREIYEAHSRGSYRQAVVAAAPHLLLAVTFACHLWREWLWVAVVVALAVGVTLVGWRRGRPAWFYPWLGYSLVPMLVAAYVPLFLVGAAVASVFKGINPLWVVLLAYIPLALWLVGSVVVRAMRPDWLLASLMLFPMPVVAGWILALQLDGGLVEYSRGGFQHTDVRLALTFFAMAAIVATFIRLRQRPLRAALLFWATLLILMVVWHDVYPLGSLALSLLVALLLLSPALLEQRIGHRPEGIDVWEEGVFGPVGRKS